MTIQMPFKPYLKTPQPDEGFRFDWVATCWRPDPITMQPRELTLGRGYSNRRDTINIVLEALPIVDVDNLCRIFIKPVNQTPMDDEWPDLWTVLTYRTDRTGSTKKTLLGSAWVEEDGSGLLVILDLMPSSNQNSEKWLVIKPKIEKTYGTTDQQ
jgi:hypothetical protein